MTYSTPPADRSRPYKALAVQHYLGVSWDEWIRRTSRADDGRDPAASSDQPPAAADSHHDTTHPRARSDDAPTDDS